MNHDRPLSRSGSHRRPAALRVSAVLALACTVAECGGEPELPTLEGLGVTETTPVLASCPATVPAGAAFEGLRVDTLATGLSVPWDIVFLDDGRALFTERTGSIRMVSADGVLDRRAWSMIQVYAQEEVGLMGLDARVDPSGRLEVYVAATQFRRPNGTLDRVVSGVWRRVLRKLDPEKGHPITLRVLRIREAAGRGGTPEVILEGLPAFMLHGGGALRFGPDDLMYLTNGDATDPPAAANPDSRRGKILRYDATGRPAGPIEGSPVFAKGIRHVQGLDWHPDTGDLFAIDHGPSGMPQEAFRGNRDELNVVRAGDDLGWPVATGTTEGGPFVSALATWVPAIAPAGLAFMSGTGTAWDGSAFVTGLRSETLRRLELENTSGSWQVRCEEVLFLQDFGRLRLVGAAPDGTLWIGTSNEDGRGVPRGGDDLLLRIHPPEGSSSRTTS